MLDSECFFLTRQCFVRTLRKSRLQGTFFLSSSSEQQQTTRKRWTRPRSWALYRRRTLPRSITTSPLVTTTTTTTTTTAALKLKLKPRRTRTRVYEEEEEQTTGKREKITRAGGNEIQEENLYALRKTREDKERNVCHRKTENKTCGWKTLYPWSRNTRST